jgi:hypothetical protein
LCEQGIVAFDKKACFVWAMNFLKYNPPESPNVVKSWGTSLEYLPECDLKNQLIEKTRVFLASLPLSFQEALPDCFIFATDSMVSCHEITDIIEKHNIPFNSNLPVTLPEDLPEAMPVPQASHEGLADTMAFTSETTNTASQAAPVNSVQKSLPEGLQEGLLEALAKTCLNHRTLNIEHRTLSIKQEQKENRSILEKDSEENLTIEEINNIVTPARQKKPKPPDPDVVEVFNCWKQTLKHPQAVLDDKRKQRIQQALKMGYSVAQLCEAILGCSHTPHNMGNNEQGQRYDSVHVIFRDADQIDRFIRNAHSPPKLQNAADKLLNTNLAASQRWLQRKLQEQQEEAAYECT